MTIWWDGKLKDKKGIEMADKKNIFKKIGDALSNRDEKEAEAKAAAEKAAAAAEAAKKAAAEKLAAEKRTAEEANRKRLEEIAKMKAEAEEKAKKEAEIAEANRKRMEEVEKMKEAAEARKAEFEARKAAAEAAMTAIIAEHTVVPGDTLSGIALKYYKHATPPYYMHIYEVNKDVIGDDPNLIRPGMVLKIQALPEELKD